MIESDAKNGMEIMLRPNFRGQNLLCKVSPALEVAMKGAMQGSIIIRGVDEMKDLKLNEAHGTELS